MKKISVVEDFEFSSFEASTDWDAINLHQNGGVPGQRSPIYYPSSESSGPTPPPVPPKHLGDSDVEDEELSPTSARVRQIQNRPLPPPPPPLRSPGFHNCSATKRAVRLSSAASTFSPCQCHLVCYLVMQGRLCWSDMPPKNKSSASDITIDIVCFTGAG